MQLDSDEKNAQSSELVSPSVPRSGVSSSPHASPSQARAPMSIHGRMVLGYANRRPEAPWLPDAGDPAASVARAARAELIRRGLAPRLGSAQRGLLRVVLHRRSELFGYHVPIAAAVEPRLEARGGRLDIELRPGDGASMEKLGAR